MVDRGLRANDEVRARLVSANQNSPSQPSALLTDFYELSMLDAYYCLGMEQAAVFEFFVRRLPDRRSFLLAAGLEQVLDYLEGLHFTDEDTMRADASPWMCSAAKMRLSKASRCCAKS